MNLTTANKRKFIKAVSLGATVSLAAKTAGVSRQTPYVWQNVDSVFAANWESAKRQGIDAMEDELHRRAFLGVEEDVFFEGKVVGQRLKHSDTLLMFALKAADPAKYKPRKEVHHSGSIDFTATLNAACERARLDNAL